CPWRIRTSCTHCAATSILCANACREKHIPWRQPVDSKRSLIAHRALFTAVMTSFETLRWRNGHLELLDQRALPARTAYLPFESAHDVAEGIRAMVVRGAPAIGCAAAYGVALEALRLQAAERSAFKAGLERAYAELAASRPTAVNLFWALGRMRDREQSLDGTEPPAVAAALLSEAHAIATEDERLNRTMGEHGATLLAHPA